MMNIRILAFGIAKDILQHRSMELEVPEESTVGQVKNQLMRSYPELERLASLRLALNSKYAEEGQVLAPDDELVLIPPVSGG